MTRTIAATTKWNLCTGCGICAGLCPKQCIHWEKDRGFYQPVIQNDLCVACGVCAEVCPGLGHRYDRLSDEEAVRGTALFCRNAWNRDPEVRHVSASGGVVSAMVKVLLRDNVYDRAFLVDSYDYRSQLKSVEVSAAGMEHVADSRYPKSRYLPVSQENAISFMRKNREKRVILVGVSCAVRGLENAIEKLHLDRKNYLFLGLFCDRVFNYNVISYFQQPKFCGEKELRELHFKNKDSGGWPGNIKLFFTDGSCAYVDQCERVKIKDYFMPERCLYCIDKLDIRADISIGDNYTGRDASRYGSNSVIIRTGNGAAAWSLMEKFLDVREVSIEEIMEAQYIDWRLNNLCYGELKEAQIERDDGTKLKLNGQVITDREAREYKSRWMNSLQMLRAGEIYDVDKGDLQRQMKKNEGRRQRERLKGFLLRPVSLFRH